MLEKLIQYKAYNSKQQIKLRSTQLLSSQLTQVIFITLFIFSKPSLLVIISTSLTTYQYIQAFRRLFEDFCHSPLRCTQHWPNSWRFSMKKFYERHAEFLPFIFSGTCVTELIQNRYNKQQLTTFVWKMFPSSYFQEIGFQRSAMYFFSYLYLLTKKIVISIPTLIFPIISRSINNFSSVIHIVVNLLA